jgi:hypothetical protein
MDKPCFYAVATTYRHQAACLLCAAWINSVVNPAEHGYVDQAAFMYHDVTWQDAT